CNPPKLNETSSISRMRSMHLVPSPGTAVLFYVAVAALALLPLAEVKLLHVAVLEQLLARAGKYHPAVLQDVAVVSDGEDAGDVLVHYQDGQPQRGVELGRHVGPLPPHRGGEPQRRLVDDQRARRR